MDQATKKSILTTVKQEWKVKFESTDFEERWVFGPDGRPARQKNERPGDIVEKKEGTWILVDGSGGEKPLLVADKAVDQLFGAYQKAKKDGKNRAWFCKCSCLRFAGARRDDVSFILRAIDTHIPKPAIEAAKKNRSVSGATARQARRERAGMARNNEAERAAEPGRTLVSETTEWESHGPVVKRVFRTMDGKEEVVYDHSKQGLGPEHRLGKHPGWQAYHERVAASKKR